MPAGDNPSGDNVPDDIPLVDGKQVINMAVNGFDYSPDTFTLKKGVPVEWKIDGKGAQGCALDYQCSGIRHYGTIIFRCKDH